MAPTNKLLFKIITSSAVAVAPWFFDFPILSIFGLVFFILLLRDIKKSHSLRDAIYLTFIWSFVYNLAVFGSWIYSIVPMTQFGIPDYKYSIAIAGFLWLVTAIGYSLPSLLFGALYYKKNIKYLNWLFVPSIWLLYEYLRAHMMSVIWYSSATYIGPHFAMGTIGYFFNNSDILRYLGGFIGVFGIGFVIILLSSYLAKLFFDKNYKKLVILSILIIVAIYIPLPDRRPDGQEVAFALIQTNRPMSVDYTPKDKRDHLQNIFSLLKEAEEKIPKDTKGLIILPEASDLFEEGQSLISRDGIELFLSKISGDNRAVIVEEDTPVTPDIPRYGASIIYSKIKAHPEHYQKTILSPGAEYLSNVMQGVSRMFVGTTTTQDIVTQTFTPNTYEAHNSTWNDINLAPFTCSDVLSPAFFNLQSRHAELAYVHVNLGYTRGNPQIERYTNSQAQFNSAQSGIPLLISANVGRSMAIDSNGEIITKTKDHGSEVLTGKITTNSKHTWYNLLGDWPIIILSLFIILFSIFKPRYKPKIKK